jgi:hypothetical protein
MGSDLYGDLAKYSMRMIEEMAGESNFEIATNFCDSRNYYCDSLWRPF